MAVKHFLINPNIDLLDIEQSVLVQENKLNKSKAIWEEREIKAQKALEKECTLKHVHGRVIVKVDMQSKNRHTFANGLTIRRERAFNNFNFREVNPSNCIVVDAENIPKGAEILVDYTTIHDSYRIFSYDSGSNDIQYYSVEEVYCYGWKDESGVWQPLKNCEFGLRVYKPYEGRISHITPERIKDHLYCTTGELKGKVVHTLRGSDYCVVFQGTDGKEDNLIRFKHSSDPNFETEEVICINNDLTEQVHNNKLYVGLTAEKAKPLT